MKKPITIIVVGMGAEMLPSTILAAMKKEHGDDLILLSDTDSEAKKIVPELKTFPLKKLPAFELPVYKMDTFKEDHKSDCRKGWRKAHKPISKI